MELVAIVNVLALLEYMFFAFRVGFGRGKYDVPAPSTSGPEEWNRLFRVQQNTVEQLVIFVPALWLCATYVNPGVAAGLGLVFVIARMIYFRTYVAEPASRTVGFVTGFLANVAMLLSGLVGAILDLMG